jgi:XTP/dITP diphosphohydrolase
LNRIVIASKNRSKISEIKKILFLKNVEIVDLVTLAFEENIEENGSTFAENALIKAKAVFRRYGLPVVADDSGLTVQCLKGMPGVFSARFAGPKASDEENNRLLLQKLRDVRGDGRKAWFSCVAVFYYHAEKYYHTEGVIHGEIAGEPRGNNGFGYDPLFFLPDQGKTMAQLSDKVKNRISHRAQAFRKLSKYIEYHFEGSPT